MDTSILDISVNIAVTSSRFYGIVTQKKFKTVSHLRLQKQRLLIAEHETENKFFEITLREKFSNTQFFWVSIFPHSD